MRTVTLDEKQMLITLSRRYDSTELITWPAFGIRDVTSIVARADDPTLTPERKKALGLL